ncbi:MAG: DUF4231 domain-containing protein [Akkermansiaceae bacterium]|nr:DUF4231 domain-containing protein [Akkermansiaceae bacterium]
MPDQDQSFEANKSYLKKLKGDFEKSIDKLKGLDDLQIDFLKNRWLDQVIWIEKRSNEYRNQHHRFRLCIVIGGVIAPALISWNGGNFNNNGDNASNSNLNAYVPKVGLFISQAVAVSVAVDQFFKFGDRWRHYRRNAELLKSHGWQFMQLTGPYLKYSAHPQAFKAFASQIEEIIQRDVEVYVNQIAEQTQVGQPTGENVGNTSVPASMSSESSAKISQPSKDTRTSFVSR